MSALAGSFGIQLLVFEKQQFEYSILSQLMEVG